MSPELRRGAAFSAALHIILGIIILVAITPSLPPEAPQGFAMTMEFGPGASGALGTPSRKAPTAAHPAPTPVKVNHPHPPTTAPHVPPPPPPPPTRVAEATPALPKPTPPQPPLAPTAKPVPTPPKPTPVKVPPKPTPHPVAKPLPMPPPPAPPAPRVVRQAAVAKAAAPRSPTHQEHATKNPAASSQALQNTLEKLRALEEAKGTELADAQDAGRAAAVTRSGGNGISQGDTNALSAAERGAIGAQVRRCWGIDTGAPGVSHFQVLLDVVVGPGGTAHVATVAPADRARVDADPVLRAFAERAVNAVLDPRCAKLPLPPAMLGAPRHLEFRFTP